MEFRIADTFTDSLTRLTNEEQKIAKTTVFDMQLNPESPGLSYHKLERARDKNFWSLRVNADIRLIVHKTPSSLCLCYIDHHDKAYAWAERRKLETHPQTGAAQFVEIRESVQEVVIANYIEAGQVHKDTRSSDTLLFSHLSKEQLLHYGVPEQWVEDVLQATEAKLYQLAEHLPAEAAEALIVLATGGKPEPVPLDVVGVDPFLHPDAQRRFRLIANSEELERALEFPWEKWSIFLHPAQRLLVEGDYSGAVRVSGSAGTGKTIVALHRAVFLAHQNPDSRVLLTTFSPLLANVLRSKLLRLVSNQPRLAERIDVFSLNVLGERLYRINIGKFKVVSEMELQQKIAEASASVNPHHFSLSFLYSEYTEVVDAWQLETWESYRNVLRLGRKTRLPESQRVVLWSIFSRVSQLLQEEKKMTYAGMFQKLTQQIEQSQNPPFDFAVVDESQDISIPQLRFLAALGGKRVNSLFFSGDIGQQIFQHPFSWKALGVDIRGRSHTLRINYRTTHQIRKQADLLLDTKLLDVDGNIEERNGTISVFNGPLPRIEVLSSQEEELKAVYSWLKQCLEHNILPHEIAIIVRSKEQLSRAQAIADHAQLKYKILDDYIEIAHSYISLCTMHLAKGLEFRAVAVIACDDEVLPSQQRIEKVADDAELEVIYNTERHLLYVACTRARDLLLVTGVDPVSEFIDDLQMGKEHLKKRNAI